jgi:hypothetical protein
VIKSDEKTPAVDKSTFLIIKLVLVFFVSFCAFILKVFARKIVGIRFRLQKC